MTKLIGRIVNSFDRGFELSIKKYKEDHDYEDDYPYVFFTNSFEVELDEKFKVYHVRVNDPENSVSKFMREFDSFEKAEEYGKIQYYRKTGEYPFITGGMTSAYKTKGKRPKIKIPANISFEGIQIEDEDDDGDALEFIVILQKDVRKAFSLNENGIWV